MAKRMVESRLPYGRHDLALCSEGERGEEKSGLEQAKQRTTCLEGSGKNWIICIESSETDLSFGCLATVRAWRAWLP